MLATVGTFDGVHLGHRYLLERLRREAAARGLRPLAVTFDRHPLSLVSPAIAPPSITAADEQADALRAEGVEVLRLPFTQEIRTMTGGEFLEMLHRDHGVKALLLGFNNHLGSDRTTSPYAEGVELVRCEELPEHTQVSSSTIRALITGGNIIQANKLLGRPFALSGKVVSGKQLGRTIGFPTANVEIAPGQLLPAPGVYEATALGLPAVVNVGSRPTVDRPGAPLSVEAHLIGFNGDLYGHTLRLEFTGRIRDEQRFPSVEALKEAIAADVAHVLAH